ncbi:unnamed protein product [Ixodes persulcatus]
MDGIADVLEFVIMVIVLPSTSAQLNGAPKVHSLGFPPDSALGDETAAYCVVRKDGSGSASILWRKDGVELKSTDRVTVAMTTSSSTLTIRRIEPGDIGNYTCIASSGYGSSEVTVPLTIMGEY